MNSTQLQLLLLLKTGAPFLISEVGVVEVPLTFCVRIQTSGGVPVEIYNLLLETSDLTKLNNRSQKKLASVLSSPSPWMKTVASR